MKIICETCHSERIIDDEFVLENSMNPNSSTTSNIKFNINSIFDDIASIIIYCENCKKDIHSEDGWL